MFVCGGGKLPDEVRARFVEMAGGAEADLVVIPTAHALADSPQVEAVYLKPWRDLGLKNVRLLHTRSRQTADDPAFSAPLEKATAVWISGGKQSALADAYVGTRVETRLQALLARGGVIGGTSAGAAILSRVMIVSGRTQAVEGKGFDLLRDMIVDQHFLQRKRMNRLLGLLAKHPGHLGFGVDERTALVLRSGRLTVLGDSYVVAYLPGKEEGTVRTEYLKKGDEADLDSLKGPEPRITSAMDLDEALKPEE